MINGSLNRGRIQDFALVVGHAWRCYECRAKLLTTPQSMWSGYKLSDAQRGKAMSLTDDSFQTVMALAEATELTVSEIEEAIDHPHARLRHLGVYKGEYNTNRF